MLDLLRAFFKILNKQQKQQIKQFKMLIYFIWVIKVKIIFKKYVRLSIVGNAKMQFIAKKQSFLLLLSSSFFIPDVPCHVLPYQNLLLTFPTVDTNHSGNIT